MRMRVFTLIGTMAATLALTPSPTWAFVTPSTFGVEFAGCVESIGVGLVPTAIAQAMLPAGFHLAGESQQVTPLVVRTSSCEKISVDGDRPKSGEIVQLGVVIVPPQPGATIDNYTLWYYTSDAKLAHALSKAGIDTQHTPTLDYDYGCRGFVNQPFSVTVRKPGDPTLSLKGTVTPSATPAGFFIANWWMKGDHGVVKMTTNVPSINVGSANLVLSTGAGNRLGQLIGGSSTGFAILQQFNTFPTAKMTVSTVIP